MTASILTASGRGLKPLAGFVVVDFSTTLPGVQASQYLADNGAEVIHVERPGGCGLRKLPGWPALGRGKKSIVLDLKQPDDARLAFELAASADVVIETYRPGVADRLGLGYAALSAVRPDLIYTSISGWGKDSPYRQAKGYEGLVSARLGVYDSARLLTARPGPAFMATNVASYGAMQAALLGTLTALLERESSGRGQQVEASLAMGLASLEVWNWALHTMYDLFPDAVSKSGPFSESGIPQNPMLFKLLTCLSKEGEWLQFAQVQPRLFRAFMRAIDLEWMFDDPEWSSLPDFEDESKRLRFWEMLLTETRKKSLADWQAVFDADSNVFAEVFRSGAQLLDHPQLVHNGQVTTIDDPRLGPVRQPAPLVRFMDDPIQLVASAPALNEHSEQVRAAVAAANRTTPAPQAEGPAKRLPLEGITILELAYFFAAPYGATLLTDLGAKVIKIEPLEGDPIRGQMGFPEVTGMHVFQGKDSVALDIKTPEGQEIIRKLAVTADVLLTSFRPGTMDRLGIGPTMLRKINPNLVVMNAMGYGIDGPYADKPAFAPSINAGGGIAMRNLGPAVRGSGDMSLDAEKAIAMRLGSSYPGLGNPDGFSSTAVGTGIVLGLLARARGGQAPRMLTSMMGTSAHVLIDQMVDHAGVQPLPGPDADLHGLSPLYRLYETANGWVFLAAPAESEWQALAEAMAPDAMLAADPRFATAEAREAEADALADAIGAAFRCYPAAEWEQRLLKHDVGCVALPGIESEAVYLGDLGKQSGYLARVEHPLFGEYDRSAPSVSFSRSATRALPGPILGGQTHQVLAGLGYSNEVIASMEQRGVIGTA